MSRKIETAEPKSKKHASNAAKQDKQERLASALRDNLFKRKAQARARAATKSDEAE